MTELMTSFGTPEKQKRNVSYDSGFKKFFSRKDVLSGILLNVIPEFKTLTQAEVVDRIRTSDINEINAETLNTEDVEEFQKIVYDVVVIVNIGKGTEEVHLIFDLEMQRIYNLTYPLMNRAIYYVSRLLSKQRIEHANYGDLSPVRSVWICMTGIPEELQNQTIHFSLEPRDCNGNLVNYSFEGIDLFSIDYILLSKNYDWNTEDEEIIKFLHAIFGNRLKDQKFNRYVECTKNVETEVANMLAEQEQYELELNCVKAEGRAEGIAEGKILGTIEFARSIDFNDRQIIAQLMKQFKLSKEEAESYVLTPVK